MRNGTRGRGRNANGKFSTGGSRCGFCVAQSGTHQKAIHARQEEPRVEQWVIEISREWRHGPEDALKLAHLLHRARQNLKHGLWSQLWRDKRLPFSKRKAEMLVVIGEGLGGLNANKCSHLPSGWRTLYYIAQLGQQLAERLIVQGRIHPRLRIQDARQLLADFRPQKKCRRSTPPLLRRKLADFSSFVSANSSNWTLSDRKLFGVQIRHLLAMVSQYPLMPNKAKPYDHNLKHHSSSIALQQRALCGSRRELAA